jgi:hypothetical protein
MEKKYTSISEIQAMTIKRFTTGQLELDWLYGLSKFPSHTEWGVPIGTISTWCGEGGVGKSRLAISVAKNEVIKGNKVLYIQNEVDLSTLASWVNDSSLSNFFCSRVTSLPDQLEVIKEVKPDLVFVDSINLMEEFGTGTAKSVKTIIDGYRSVINGIKCHIVVLCQLNKEGSATGSTALTHLPDINFQLTNTDLDGVFKVGIGKKHRYGRTGSSYFGLWKHIETGVTCISNNREKDDRWTESVDIEDCDSSFKFFDGADLEFKNDFKFFNKKIEFPDGADLEFKTDFNSYIKPTYNSKGERITIDNCSPAVKKAFNSLNGISSNSSTESPLKRDLRSIKCFFNNFIDSL